MTSAVTDTKKDLRGRQLAISIPDGDPIFGTVVDLETGESLGVRKLELCLDMSQEPESIKLTLQSGGFVEERKLYTMSVPVKKLQRLFLIVQMSQIGEYIPVEEESNEETVAKDPDPGRD